MGIHYSAQKTQIQGGQFFSLSYPALHKRQTISLRPFPPEAVLGLRFSTGRTERETIPFARPASCPAAAYAAAGQEAGRAKGMVSRSVRPVLKRRPNTASGGNGRKEIVCLLWRAG